MPLHARILPDYPTTAPVVFLVPAPEMAIMKNHKNIDQTGRCHFPYLQSWGRGSNLVGLLAVMVEEFSKVPPLYTRPAALPATPPQSGGNVFVPGQQAPQPAFVPNVPPQYGQQQQGSQPPQQQQQQQPWNSGAPPNFVPPAYGSNNQQQTPPQPYGSNQGANAQQPGAFVPFVPPPITRTQTPSVATFIPPTVDPAQTQKPQPPAADESEEDQKLCIVCFERPKEALITPCNHIALCMQDANYMKNHKNPCPVCRGAIQGVIRVFLV